MYVFNRKTKGFSDAQRSDDPGLCLVHDGFLRVHPVTKCFLIASLHSAQLALLFWLLQVYFQLSAIVQIPEVPTSPPPPRKHIYQDFSLVLLWSTTHLFLRMQKSYFKNILHGAPGVRQPCPELSGVSFHHVGSTKFWVFYFTFRKEVNLVPKTLLRNAFSLPFCALYLVYF